MASREAMNMGSRSSNVISELKSVISLLGQATDNAFQKVTSGISRTSSFNGSGTSASSSLVAPNPVFNAPPIVYLTQTGNGIVSSGTSESNNLVARGAGTNLTQYVSQNGGGTLYSAETGGGGSFGGGGGRTSGSAAGPNPTSGTAGSLGKPGNIIAGLFAGFNTIADMMPSTSDVLEGQLLQKRASYFLGTSPGAVTANQNIVSGKAMLSGENPQMDVMRAQIAAQSYGLGSSSNKLLESAANVSNLMPGIGVEGSMRATGAMQQASSVNMLRGIGIQLRGPGGSLKGPDEVIEEIWQKICRDYGQAYGSGKKPPYNEVQISLQPGNALDSMLNQYFGSDPMLKQLVANGLIFKSKEGGSITKENLAAQGATTESMLTFTKTAATGQAMLTSSGIVAGATTGYDASNKYIETYYKSFNDETKALGAELMFLKSSVDTLLTAFNGNLFSVVASTLPTAVGLLATLLKKVLPPGTSTGDVTGGANGLSQLFSNPLQFLTGLVPGLASGGPVDKSMPYIVGEKGPELFVPGSDGTIVSNDKLTSGSYTYNFTINAASGNTQDLVTEIKSVLVQLETNRKVSES